jgi:uncharacterized membrane protein
MILGRNTVQWISLITAAGALAQVLAVNLVKDIDPTLVATIVGSIVAFLGVAVAFIANTSTTPSADPHLEKGTTVTIEKTGEQVKV